VAITAVYTGDISHAGMHTHTDNGCSALQQVFAELENFTTFGWYHIILYGYGE